MSSISDESIPVESVPVVPVPDESAPEPPAAVFSENEEPRMALRDWGLQLLRKVLHPFTVFGTPLFLLGLLIYSMVHAFFQGVPYGIRSISGVLLPLIVCTFIFLYHKELLIKLGTVDAVVSFAVSLVWGIVVMVMIQLFADIKSPVPVTELFLSVTFSILVFGYVSLPQSKILSYFYGTISGLLIFIVFLGFPLARF